MHRLLTGLLDIAMTSNTDSRELDKALKHLVIRPNRMYSRLDKKEIAQIIEICLAYTANKQKELLEWVEQEISLYYLHHDGEGEHKLFAEIDELLKNKRKEL